LDKSLIISRCSKIIYRIFVLVLIYRCLVIQLDIESNILRSRNDCLEFIKDWIPLVTNDIYHIVGSYEEQYSLENMLRNTSKTDLGVDNSFYKTWNIRVYNMNFRILSDQTNKKFAEITFNARTNWNNYLDIAQNSWIDDPKNKIDSDIYDV